MIRNYSKLALIFSFVLIFVLRLFSLSENELSWDVFGYYLYLPATFIHGDPMLHDISWIHEIKDRLPVTGTLYQIATTDQGKHIYFFLMGMSLTYLPFFLIGHLFALAAGYPADGFSLPYQYAIALGSLLYTLAGLIFLRKILRKYFSEIISALVILIIVTGTNYLNYVVWKNLETTNILFALLTIIIWFSIKWTESFRFRYLLITGLACTLSVMVKPSEAFCVLIPLLWGVSNRESLRQRLAALLKYRGQILKAILICLVLVLPQMVYWKISTGYFIFDSYKNPGVGLDLGSPHIYKALFSFRKGWLIYTPVMIFALAGLIVLYKKRKEIFLAASVYLLISFYIISSWTEWWYGAAYGLRPMITSYALLSIPLGFFLQWIGEKRKAMRVLFSATVLFLVFLNLFQLWQYHRWIIDPYRTTRAYYFAVFGKTSVDPETRNLLLPFRSFEGGQEKFNGEENYDLRNIGSYDFETPDSNRINYYVRDSLNGNTCFRLDSSMQFSPSVINTYGGLTSKNHAWIRARADIFIPSGYEGELPCLTLTFSRKEGVYGYRTLCIDEASLKYDQWISLSMDYMTPEIRDERDRFLSYIWHRGKTPVYIDNFKIDVYEPKW